MKKLTLLIFALVSLFAVDLSADTACYWDSYFSYPKDKGSYEVGKDVYVKVAPKKHQDISYMELYLNGKFIRKESSYPFEWCRPNSSGDNYLRNLKAGTYKLKVRIKDKCGKWHEKYCEFYVKGHHNNPNPGYCEWDSWFKYPKDKQTFSEGKHVYVRVDPKKHQDIQYMELYVNSKLIRKESSYPYEWCRPNSNEDSYLRNLKDGTYKLKVRILDKCGKWHEKYCIIYVKGHHNEPGYGQCEWESWFKYPKHNSHYEYGKPMYVRVDAKKYQDIQYMELYVNDKMIRKESSYPYEWCRPNSSGDDYLRKLKPGKYELKVKFLDRCHKWHEKVCVIYIKGHGNGHNNDCDYQTAFQYPKHKSSYSYGKPVYVKLDAKNHSRISYVELYCDGKLIRKESSYPYEWCRPNSGGDYNLRKLKPGTHKLKVKIVDKCGGYKEEYCEIYVKRS